MNKALLLGLGLGATTLFTAVGNSVQAAVFTPLPSFTDADFNTAKTTTTPPFAQPWEEDWVAETRGGNNALNGTFELSINNWTTNTTNTPVTTAQNVFTSGQAVDFSVTYDGTNAVFSWGTNLPAPTYPRVLTSSNLTEGGRFPNGLDSMFIRLRAQNRTDANSFQLTNIVVDGNAYGGTMFANETDNLDYLLITDITSSFTMTGTAVLAWAGTIPQNSNLDMTIKLGYGGVVTGTPEPMTLVGTGLVALGMMFLGKAKPKIN